MALNWNEIKERARKFSKEWEATTNEEADAKPFMDAFFEVFGITRRKIGTFEHRVKKLSDGDGYIDMLWKGMILIEMKSRGKNLDKAFEQAKDYTHGLKEYEFPKFILVCDFENFRLFDLEKNTNVTFKIAALFDNVAHFSFLLGYEKKVYKEQDPANIEAAQLMGKLHDALLDIGYEGHQLEVYLVRLLFCLFAEDTSIFEKEQLQDFITNRTNIDGSDLASKLHELFQVLNTPKDKRFKNIDEDLAAFEYVNGKLFEEPLQTASFDSKMRTVLLECCYFNWSNISPAIFGSMFQSVMNPKERRNLGAHYTSELNILKLIKPLFLDELWAEFEKIKTNKSKLGIFHKRISELKFLDPACGCGNFLIITYRELRLLEIAILESIYKNQTATNLESIIWLDVDMMYGIEYEEFPARIAEVAMWLIDHQMNTLIGNKFGNYFRRMPLKKAANIVHGNALQIDWETVIAKKDLSYILGNPPFVGYKLQNKEQKEDLLPIFKNRKGTGVMDYVAAWYLKAAKYIEKTKIKAAFVSTNSICQGEQVGVLWDIILNDYKMYIHFAHQTFRWSNEASGNAAVHCVIVGFANFDIPEKRIFKYEDINHEAYEIKAKNINPYLLDSKNIFLSKKTHPLKSNTPTINYGSEPREGGYLLLSEIEKDEAIIKEPFLSNYIKRFVSSDDFINNNFRYCLWLVDIEPEKINASTFIKNKLLKVKDFRQNSLQKQAQKTAEIPSLFTSIRQPKSDYLLIPIVSSETRKYIPIGYLDKDTIASNACFTMENATLYHFGLLTSKMHMAWVKIVCGRLESRFRYSNTVVYNNYPWPENATDKQIKTIETKAQKILDIRASFKNSTLADLYNVLTMPPALVKAHNDLDKAVDLAYRNQPFINDTNRMEFLFELYEKYTADLFTKEKVKRVKKEKYLEFKA